MKQFKLTLVLTILMSMVGLQAFADWDTSTRRAAGYLYYYLDNDNYQAQVIKSSALEGYKGKVNIPSTVTILGKTYSVTSIGDGAFRNCKGLTSVTIGNNVTSIGQQAFYGSSALTSVIIPNSVTSIGNQAFSYCSGLTSVTIGNSVTSIGDYAFSWCSGLTSVTLNSNAIVSKAYTADNNMKTIFGEQVTEYVIGGDVTSIGQYAFYKCYGLESVTIGNGVTSIGDRAFYDCYGLTSVTLNSNALASKTTSYSFLDIFGGTVQKIIIGDSVTSIGDGAFYNCSGLTSVTIGNSVTSIGFSAFSGCPDLTSVTIPNNSVKSIGNSAFSGCSGLTSVTIPNSVTSIGDGAFGGCSGLTSITIPESVTKIGDDAFNGCFGLTSVTLNSNAIVSKTYTRENNIKNIFGEQVTKYVIGDNVKSIGESAFAYCSDLSSITIGNSVTSIGDDAFNGCSGLTSMIVESGNTQYDSRNNCNAIIETTSNTLITGCKNTTIPNSVTSIGDGAFYRCTGLTTVNIPDKVTSIGAYAFRDCSGLESVTIGSGVTSYGNSAFQCSNLTSVTALNPTPVAITQNVFTNRTNATLYVPNKDAYQAADYWKEFKEIIETPNIEFADANVKAICVAHWDTNSDGELSYDEAAAVKTISNYFANNTSITSFDEFAYFTGVTSIGNRAFDDCSGLTSITIPNSVTSIDNLAFYKCSGLKTVTIPNSVTSIGYDAFASCSGLTSIIVESGNTKYDSRDNCNAIIETASNTLVAGCKNTTIPNSVMSIGNYAFYGCSGLTSVTIPNSVTSIGNRAFEDCPNLTSIVVESGNPNYDSRNDCNAIIETASNTLIAGCKNTIIPNNVASIGSYAFYGCTGLTSITIPNSVTSIGDEAFDGCSGLTSVTALNPTPVAITDYVFTNRTNATLYVPKGSKDAYKAADYWKEFKEIIEIDPTGIDQISLQENGEQGIDEEGAVWYTIDGKQIDKPKKGINIIRMKNGTTKKVVVK